MIRTPLILKLFISSILFLGLSFLANAQTDTAVVITDSASTIMDTDKENSDTLQVKKAEKVKEKHLQYFRVGVDVSKVVRSALTDRYSTAEFLVESIWKEKLHYVLEGGYATSKNDSNISFTASSVFVRVGFDKYFFGKLYKADLDNAFVGARIGGAYNKRGEAIAKLWDPYYGNSTITKGPASQLLYWIELTAGFRMEVAKNIFLGWNVRGKTFINPKKTQELTPEYIAGYGIARKQPNFDYNFYFLYGFGKR